MEQLQWEIGEIQITQLLELEAGELIQSIIHNASHENIRRIPWLMPHFANHDGSLRALVQGFLIKANGKNILIDTCNGNDKQRTDVPEWANLKTDYLAHLRTAGVDEGGIDVVACTHLHMDHVGWNTRLKDGSWNPTFPNARYLFARQEYDYWKTVPSKEIADDHAAFKDSVEPIVAEQLADFVEPNHQLTRGVRFIPSPGHTPCHVSVLVESAGERAIISGDFLHHPCQIAHPDWATDADTLPDQGIETRLEILNDIADTGTLLLGSHFAHPVGGRVRHSTDGLVLEI